MEKKEKRVVQIEIDDQVRKLTVEGMDKDAQVVMRQELSDDELDSVAGGMYFAKCESLNIPVIDIRTQNNQCSQLAAPQGVNTNLSLI